MGLRMFNFTIVFTFAIVLLMHTVSAQANTEVMEESRDRELIKIFNYAKDHNVKALEKMKTSVDEMNSSTVTISYSLALYMANPKKYESQYVDSFPNDYSSIMHDLYEKVELRKLTPKFLYSIDAIGEIALKGNNKAIEKVVKGVLRSDGAVTSLFCDYTNRVLDANTKQTLLVLLSMDSNERAGIYECIPLLSPSQVNLLREKIRNIKTSDQRLQLLIQEIEGKM